MKISRIDLIGLNGNEGGTMNLAALSQAEMDLIEAGKAACLIRYQCRALKGKERQVIAPRDVNAPCVYLVCAISIPKPRCLPICRAAKKAQE